MSNVATATTERETEASPPTLPHPLPKCDGCGRFEMPPVKWRPPLDPAPVLAAHSKVTVLLMNAVEKQARDANVICDDSSDEDREWIMDKRSARWWDVKDALEELAELVDRRS